MYNKEQYLLLNTALCYDSHIYYLFDITIMKENEGCIMSKDSILDKMKEEGLRLTPQRLHIVELLFKLSHPTADQIYITMAE
jgi:hypothetical protein